MFWRFSRVAVFSGLLPALAASNSGIIRVTSIRSWSHSDATRVIIEASGPFEYKSDRAYGPDRLFFDVLHARPWIANRRFATREIGDRLVQRVRIAETSPGTTRIVFDLTAPADFKITKLDEPDRLVIELRPLRNLTSPPPAYVPPVYSASIPVAPAIPYVSEGASKRPRQFVYPPPPMPAQPYRQILMPGPPPALATTVEPALYLYNPLTAVAIKPPRQVRAGNARVIPAARTAMANATPLASENASRSLTRALGLKVNRIVIDAGHGGHDDGTIGKHGLREKDVVLDVALRVSRLVEDRMGAQVVLTRSEDTFIPLHERTAIANERKADLFLSIHANSSPAPEVGGTETFYLNFANSPGAIDVAARENAGADKSVGELRGLIQSITMNDKIEESRTFAQDIQTSIQAQAARSNAEAHNRGVKRAPFVVLIGASMPSVLAEIGFLSNSKDESNLRKPEYRQKVAEALYKGIAQYARSLSHYDMAREVVRTEKAIPAGPSQAGLSH
jgi:N-acetylmuramoyl-L-alanine amidase